MKRDERNLKLKRLSAAKKAVEKQTAQEYINLFFDSIKKQKGIDKAAFEKGIEWLYGDLLDRKKPEIVYCDSWASAMYKIVSEKKYSESRGNNLRDCVYNAFEYIIRLCDQTVREKAATSVRNHVWENVQDRISRLFYSSYYFSIHTSVIHAAYTSLFSNTEVETSLGIKLEPFERKRLNTLVSEILWSDMCRGSISESANVAYLDFFSQVGIFQSDAFDRYKDFVRSGAFAVYMYENCVFAIQPPVNISMDESGRLHSLEDKAVKFKDGTSHYFVHGENVPSSIFEKKDSITANDFLTERDKRIQGIIYEILGDEKMMDLLGAGIVDRSEIRHRNGSVEYLKLIKEINNNRAWLQVTSSTDPIIYFLEINSKYDNAVRALNSYWKR
jgi:hypothetical protein